MIITYLRSSSIGTHEMCPNKYYIGYSLGIQEPGNFKADCGSVVHRAMELLALEKLAKQNNQEYFDTDDLGRIKVDALSPNDFLQLCFDYYTLKWSHHNWHSKFRFISGTMLPIEFIRESFKKALLFQNGMFHPGNRTIVGVEKNFDFQFSDTWAKYKYKLPNNEEISGQLAMRGTIDLITELSEDTAEIIDWKTGKRLNWGTGKEKDFKALSDDTQLKIYYWALNKLYPQYTTVLITIFFINDGGPYTITFHKEDLPNIEQMIRKKFDSIRTDTLPRKRTGLHCRFCHYYNKSFEGDELNICNRIQTDLKSQGIEKTNKKYMTEPYSFLKYKNPGA